MTITLHPLASLRPVRLHLAPRGTGPQPLDGVWWPRSTDLAAELPLLIRALPHSWPQIAHATVNDTMWSAFPGRILIANHVIQLHRNANRHAPNTICFIAPGKGRWDLLVVPPHTSTHEALRLLATADAPEGPSRSDFLPDSGDHEFEGVVR